MRHQPHALRPAVACLALALLLASALTGCGGSGPPLAPGDLPSDAEVDTAPAPDCCIVPPDADTPTPPDAEVDTGPEPDCCDVPPDADADADADAPALPDADAEVEVETGPEPDCCDIPPDADADADAGPDTDLPPAACGNGQVDPGEACDDGNTAPGDWCSPDCAALVDVSTYEAFAGHRSFGMLPTTNGLAAAVYTLTNDTLAPDAREQNRLTAFHDHLYRQYGPDEATRTRDYLFDLYFGYRKNGVSSATTWLNRPAPELAEYLPGTGIVHTVQRTADLVFDHYFFVPFAGPDGSPPNARLLVALCRVTVAGSAPVDDAALFSLINVHAGGDLEEGVSDPAAYADEDVRPGTTATVVIESQDDHVFAYRNLVAAGSDYTFDAAGGPNNPWQRVTDGAHFDSSATALVADDVAVGFENRLTAGGPLGVGSAHWVGVVLAYEPSAAEAEIEATLDAFIAGRGPEALLQAERAAWDAWHAAGRAVVGPNATEQRLYRQSLAVLRMAQVRETPATGCPSGRCAGQILASLPPGGWNIAWVRDASYAILGLTAAGHLPEAEAGLAFMLQAEVAHDGSPVDYQERFIESRDASAGVWGLGATLSAEYAISICRYYGQGREESDSNAAGPNIEWDNWGLFLWAFADYVGHAEAGADAFVAAHWTTVRDRVANVLVDLIDPDTGLLLPDSSIWERHWCPHGQCSEPETRKRFVYSATLAQNGLDRLAALTARAAALGVEPAPDAVAAQLRAAAATLRAGIVQHAVVVPPTTGQPALAGNLEELPYAVYYLDQAVVEAINLGVVHPGSREAFGTLAAFDRHLRIGSHSPGYFRNDDPTWYDRQEWVVIDLRTVAALARMGQLGKARTLLDWITAQATANFDLIGELLSDGVYDPGSEDDRWRANGDPGGDYQGAIPMGGFGPGAYILALRALYPDAWGWVP